ncbi:MAG: sigma-70 family RNA polymerase sigma factor [Armatimonadetes bacterium]|nr:sigma-70 family RNA polymerase sigma factor [Armatimonadota bacterium]
MARTKTLQRPAGRNGADTDSLFRAFRASRDPQLHADLTYRFMPLVHQVARRYARSGIPTEYLHQIGYIGLMNAVANFDPNRSVKFETYARHLIAGEIRHYLRDQSTTVRRPRWLYEMDHRVSRAAMELTQRKGRAPTAEEIARKLRIMPDEVHEVLQARESLRFVSLDEEREGDDGAPMAQHDRIASTNLNGVELPIDERVQISDAIERLSILQRKVVYYLFFMDLTQTEAARKLGISQKHVSRVMHAALRRLRDTLRPEAI